MKTRKYLPLQQVTLQVPRGFPKPLASPFVANRATRSPGSLSGCPHSPAKEGRSRGIPGQLENYRAKRDCTWYFPGVGKELWEQEEGFLSQSHRGPFLPSLIFCQRPTCLTPCEQTAWCELLDPPRACSPGQVPGHASPVQVTLPDQARWLHSSGPALHRVL